MRGAKIILVLMLVGGLVWLWFGQRQADAPWSGTELAAIRSLWLGSLAPLPPDPTNRVADHPEAAALGHRLFFDTRLSGNGAVACSTCHRPELHFTDGLPVSMGIAPVERNAMTVVGAAYSPWYFWDGRKDSLWSQATAPLEHEFEHGSHRLTVVGIVASDPDYRQRYEGLFGELPRVLSTVGGPPPAVEWVDLPEQDRQAISTVFTNLGKTLAAYQRLLLPGPSRFDRYAAGILGESSPTAVFEPAEQRGLRLFIGPGQCTNCHNGALFTNNTFHNTGSLSAPGQLPSMGRIEGTELARLDPFNCLSEFSDDPHNCAELEFMKTGDDVIGAHRTPSLRNVAQTAPYMHAGQLESLEAVVAQYDLARDAMVGHNEAKPLDLSRGERSDLVAFLKTLDGPVNAEPHWLVPPATRLP
jgi:cytochrome c peroxidase